MWSNGKIAAVAVVVLVALVPGLGVFACSPGAPDVWASMQDDLEESYVFCVEVRAGSRQETLIGASAKAFSEAFIDATFDEDNRKHFGPTSDIVLFFCYEGRAPISVTQWPDDRFELSVEGEQFLVSSPELTRLLRSGGFDHQQ